MCWSWVCLDPAIRDSFYSDFSAAQEAVQAGVVPSRSAAAEGHWEIWTSYCDELQVDPLLNDLDDRNALGILQVFAHRYWVGTISPSKNVVRSRTVEDVLRSVGQTFEGLGSQDPRLTLAGKLKLNLRRQLNAMRMGRRILRQIESIFNDLSPLVSSVIY